MRKFLGIFLAVCVTFLSQSSMIASALAYADETNIAFISEVKNTEYVYSDYICDMEGNVTYREKKVAGIIVVFPDEAVTDVSVFGLDSEVFSICKYDKQMVVEGSYWNSKVDYIPDENDNTYYIYSSSQLTFDAAYEVATLVLKSGMISKAYVVNRNMECAGMCFGIILQSDSISESAEDFDCSVYPEISDIILKQESRHDGLTLELDLSMDEIPEMCRLLEDTYDELTVYPRVELVDSGESTYSLKIVKIHGDISGNNSIDLYDAIEISKYIMKMIDFDDYAYKIADYDDNGKVDLYDAVEIAKSLM